MGKVVDLQTERDRRLLEALAAVTLEGGPPDEVLMNIDDARELGYDVSRPCHCARCGGHAHFHWKDRKP